MTNIVSSARLIFYKRANNQISYSMHSFQEKHDLLFLLFQYYERLGVDEYEEDDKEVRWKLNNNWFTSEEIQRMLSLPVFI